METCSICLDALDGGAVALACGHRFHGACLAQCAAAVGTAATTSRRGTLTACPNCRTTSRVAPVTSASHGVGDKVLALWGYKWYPGVVDEVLDGGRAYKIAWDDGVDGESPAAHVRAAPLAVDVDAAAARDASPPAVTPRPAPPVPKSSRFTGVCRRASTSSWEAKIKVRGFTIHLGGFDDEEDAARAYDAAVVKYRNTPTTVNFPGEAPLASVLAALPAAPGAPAVAPPRRSGRAPAPRVIVDPEAPNIRDQKDRTRTTAPAKQSVPPRDAAKTSPLAVVTPRAAPPVEQGRKPVPKKRGRPPKSPAAVEEAEAAKQPSLEAEIKAAIAKKPKVAAESTALVLHTTKQVNDLGAVDIVTIADLALASVDKEKHLRAVSTNKRIRQARPVFWNLKSAAAKRLDVDIGALPRAAYGSCALPC